MAQKRLLARRKQRMARDAAPAEPCAARNTDTRRLQAHCLTYHGKRCGTIVPSGMSSKANLFFFFFFFYRYIALPEPREGTMVTLVTNLCLRACARRDNGDTTAETIAESDAARARRAALVW